MKRISAALLSLLVLAPFSPAQTYSITDLGAMSGFESVALAINDRGDVAGYYTGKNYQQHAFLFTRAEGMRDLVPPGSPEITLAYGVNASDEVALYGFNEFVWQANLWKPNGKVTVLGSYAVPQGINRSGTIAGYSSLSNHAVQWTQGGEMQDLGTLGGAVSEAYAINDSGQIVGYSAVASGPGHAFLWTEQTGMQDLGTLADEADPVSISPSGNFIAGHYWVGLGQKPFLWTPTGGMQAIDPLSGASVSWASGANDAGQVVGCATMKNNSQAAFLWTRSTGAQDLLSLVPDKKGFTQLCAAAINEAGQIVGAGLTQNSRNHAVLLTPIKR